MYFEANKSTQERVERILEELYPRASSVSGKMLGEIHDDQVAKEARQKKKPEPEAPKTGFEAPVVSGTSYANPPPPSPRRSKWITRAEWEAHLALNNLPVRPVRPKVRLCS
jgi:hypothetical protein